MGEKLQKTEREELAVIQLSIAGLEHQGISVADTLAAAVRLQLGLYDILREEGYLRNALLKLKVYLNMGFPFNRYEKLFNKVLAESGIGKEAFFLEHGPFGPKVRLTKTQVRSMIRRWPSSKYHTMPIQEVVNDIVEKVKTHQQGVYTYHTTTNEKSRFCDDMYQLVIDDKDSYFCDVNMGKCYRFE